MESSQGWGRYEKSPMVEVAFQLHFPEILTILTAPPAAFQERIRAEYPLFQATQDRRGYVFAQQDRQAHVTLTYNTLTMTLSSFNEWGEVRQRFSNIESAFRAAYNPALYNRTGLRFRSLFRPHSYGISKLEWVKFVNGNVLGPFAVPNVKGMLASSKHEVVMSLAEGTGSDRFHLTHGFVTVTEPSKNQRSGEPGYLLDQDYFTIESLQPERAMTRLDRFNEEAARFFRLCVLDPLHQAMMPLAA